MNADLSWQSSLQLWKETVSVVVFTLVLVGVLVFTGLIHLHQPCLITVELADDQQLVVCTDNTIPCLYVWNRNIRQPVGLIQSMYMCILTEKMHICKCRRYSSDSKQPTSFSPWLWLSDGSSFCEIFHRSPSPWAMTSSSTLFHNPYYYYCYAAKKEGKHS